MLLRAPIGLAVLLLAAIPAAAQTPESRAAEIAREQEEKARRLTPYKQNWFERELLQIQEAGGFAVARGFFVSFGDIKSGSGIAIGPAYGKTFGNGAFFTAKAAYSLRQFKLAQVFVQAPPFATGRLIVNGRVRWQDAPELAVYELGM